MSGMTLEHALGNMTAYRRNLVCRTLQNVLAENLLDKCLWGIAPFSFSMHTDIPNSNRCTGRGPRRPRAHGAPRARKSGLAPWTRLQYSRRRPRRLQRFGSSPACCLTTCAQRWRRRAQRAFRAAAPPVSPAAPTSSAAFWVKPGVLPNDVRPALASAGSASIPRGSASSITGGAHVLCSILGQARYAASRRAACISAARAAAWARLSAGTAPQSVESPLRLRTRRSGRSKGQARLHAQHRTCFNSHPWQ